MSKEFETAIAHLPEAEQKVIRIINKIKDDCPPEVMTELMEELVGVCKTFQNGTLINEWVLCQTLVHILGCLATNMVFKLGKELNWPDSSAIIKVVEHCVYGMAVSEFKSTLLSASLRKLS